MISRDIHLKFSSLEFVQIRAWKRSTTSLIMCNDHDFSAYFFNIDKIIIESVEFHDCGKSKRISGNDAVKLVQITRSSFVESSPNSPWIKSNVSELQVTNCIFNKGKATVVYIQSNSASNAAFKNVSFKHSEAGSIEYCDISLESKLVVSNYIFYNISTDGPVINVHRVDSVEITYSVFTENSVVYILSTHDTDKVTIADCYINSNNVSLSTINSYCSGFRSLSIFSISNTIAINNHNAQHRIFSK